MRLFYPFPALFRSLLRVPARLTCECDSYLGFTLLFLTLFLASFVGFYDILIFEESFPSDFTWPPHVFDLKSYDATERQVDFQEFSASLLSSLEEWKLNSAFWKLEGDHASRPAFAPGMMGMVSQLPVIRSHIKYMKAITTPVRGLPPPRICLPETADGSNRAGGRNVGLLILVKSAVHHVARRDAIRRSYASGATHRSPENSYEVLFLLGLEGGNGVSGQGEFSYKHQAQIMEEQHDFGDIIQCQFVDTYFNNTSKTMAGIHYVVDGCPILDPRHGFVFLTDDDMFVNVGNLEKLLEEIKAERDSQESLDVYLGYKFPGSKPKRWRFSKWYVSTSEYPFSWYPPYITAATVLLSKDTLEKFYYASHFLPIFRFDDIYLAILAYILQIESQHHSDGFYYDYLAPVDQNVGLFREKIIAMHGFHDPDNMMRTYDLIHNRSQRN